jgi:xylulokinase
MSRLVDEADGKPTGILYFPYLSGSGAPCHDQYVRGAFIGLSASHRRGDLVKAVLEGTAYESESIRRAAEKMTGNPIDELVVVGGGAKNRDWLQIKADVSGCRCHVPSLPEATVLGAALTAALGSSLTFGIEDALEVATSRRSEGSTIVPDADRHEAYRDLYETGYMDFQEALRKEGSKLRGESSGAGVESTRHRRGNAVV